MKTAAYWVATILGPARTRATPRLRSDSGVLGILWTPSQRRCNAAAWVQGDNAQNTRRGPFAPVNRSRRGYLVQNVGAAAAVDDVTSNVGQAAVRPPASQTPRR